MLGFSVEAGTLDWYAKALGDGRSISEVFWSTFEIALLVTAHCLLLGYPLGFSDRHHDAGLGDAGLHLRAAAALDLACWCAPMPGWCCWAATACSIAG